MTPEQRRGRALRVSAMMEDGDLKSAFDDVEADLTAEWQRCFDAVERENLWRAQNVLRMIRTKLTQFGSLGTSDITELRRLGINRAA